MKSALTTAQSRLDFLQEFLTLEESFETVDGRVREASWRTVSYCAVIVRTSAILEEFVKDLIAEYCKNIAMLFPTLDHLPEAVRSAHDDQCRKLLARGTDDGRFSGDDTNEMARALVSCLDMTESYSLSPLALGYHAANLRLPMLREILQRMDLRTDSIEREIKRTHQWDLLEDRYQSLESFLRDIMERRNEAAHGDPADLLDRTALRAVVSVTRELLALVYESLVLHLFKTSPAFREVGIIRSYMTGPDAHIAHLGEQSLKAGDLLAAVERNKSHVIFGELTSIQLDEVDIEEINGASLIEGKDIGLKISPEALRRNGQIKQISPDLGGLLMVFD